MLSPPLVLFIVMLPKVHWTSQSRVSGSGWVTIPSWLSWSLRPLLYGSSVYSCLLFLISSCSVRSLPFLSFIVSILAWNVPLMTLIFLKRSLVFLILLFSSTSLHHSLKKAFWPLLAILCNSVFNWVYLSLSPLLFTSLLSSAICKASSDNHFAFLHFFLCGMVLFTVSCTVLQISVHSSSDILSTGSNPLNLFITSTDNQWTWFRPYLNTLVVFPLSSTLSLNFAIRSWWV